MRKKGLAALALAVVLAAMPAISFAQGSKENTTTLVHPQAPNSSSGGGSSSSGSSSAASQSAVHVESSGAKTTGAGSETDSLGTRFGVVVDATTSTGESITVNDAGEAVIGDTAIGLAKDAAATAGLPAAVVDAIQGINAGAGLASLGLGIDLNGYSALTGTHAIVVKDNYSGLVKEGTPVEVSLYVSSLVGGLNGVSILFYDNTTGLWRLIPVVSVDPVAKTVSFVVANSGTVCIVHK